MAGEVMEEREVMEILNGSEVIQKVCGSEDIQKLRGSEDIQKVCGSEDIHKAGGSEDIQKLCGSEDIQKLCGSEDIEKLCGSEDIHKAGGSEDIKKVCGSESQEAAKRVVWASKVEYMLTCIGYCVGLGNIWRFPYLCYKNGGGAFLIPYVIMAVCCGLPLVTLEQLMGQYVGLGILPIWNICPLSKGIGISCIIINSYLSSTYIIVIVYSIYYVYSSFAYELPWKQCGHPWNTDACRDMDITTQNESFNIQILRTLFGENSTYTSPAEEYFENSVLEKTSGIHELGGVRSPLLVCLLIAWVPVFFTTVKSIRSGGKAAYVTATIPYILLTVLVIRGAMLPGSIEGVKYYLIPDWEKLFDSQVWFSAALQIIYSNGLCYGIFITMSSYNSFNNNPLRDAMITVSVNCLTSFYAGFAVFSVLGAMAHQFGVTVEDVVASGPGLAFIAYPRALATMPLSQLWSVLFFGMLVLLGLSTEVCHFETILSAMADQFPILRRQRYRTILGLVAAATFFCVGIIFVTQGGMYLFFLVDWYGMGFALLIIAVLESIVFCWIYGYKRLAFNVEEMIGYKPHILYRVGWQFLIPILFVVVFMISVINWRPATLGSYEYPPTANTCGWILAVSSLVPIPIVAIMSIVNADGNGIKQKFMNTLKPNEFFAKQVKSRREAAECMDRVELQYLSYDEKV